MSLKNAKFAWIALILMTADLFLVGELGIKVSGFGVEQIGKLSDLGQLRLECARLMEAQGYPEPTGMAKVTGAFNLPSKYVIHTVGPIAEGFAAGMMQKGWQIFMITL